ncbi:CHAD domain-containing protein [Oceanobacter mangrovi]|uniref:CHAD domain-containing protein n=1 Tax=Oceanobacter mangrovi TaxID=2862510 RepID=UPI001C8E9A95
MSVLHEQLLQLRQQLKRADTELPDELIHDIRVLTKQTRAQSRLLKSAQQRRQLNRSSKRLAAVLAPSRDATVMLATLDSLLVTQQGSDFAALYEYLQRHRQHQRLKHKRLYKRVGVLASDSRWLEGRLISPRKLAKIIARAEQACRKLYPQLSMTPQTPAQRELWHDWRKAVKAWFYLLKLQVLKQQAEAVDMNVRALAEQLGLIHDLHMLEDFLQAADLTAEATAQLEVLQTQVRQREHQLIAGCQQLARLIYKLAPDS